MKKIWGFVKKEWFRIIIAICAIGMCISLAKIAEHTLWIVQGINDHLKVDVYR